VCRRNTRGFEAARDEAGLSESLTFHKMRHAFVSIGAHRGVALNVLAEFYGGDLETMQRVYLHLYNREQAEEDYRKAMGGAS
jgi:site-specific recombinase XerD